tara:strand:- start:1080 stop:1295 length:216 start_codon:yes stop_codon:yes gene_type:complete
MSERLEERIVHLERKVSKIELESAVIISQVASVAADIKDIKDSQGWVIKLIIGALILAIIGFITGGGLIVG